MTNPLDELVRDRIVEVLPMRPIPGYENEYEISTNGDIFRIGTGKGSVPGRKIALGNHAEGYLRATLFRNNQGKTFLVHRLVILTFVGVCPPGHEVNHKDGNKKHNHLSNLEYVTGLENNRHARANGIANLRPAAKLQETQVIAIRKAYIPGIKGYKRVAKEFGIKWECVRDIIKGNSWADLGEQTNVCN